MATETPTTDVVKAAGDTAIETAKAAETVVKADADIVAKTAETAAPKAPVAPVQAAKRVAKVAKAKAAPVRKAVAKSVKTVAAVQPAPIQKAAKAVATAAGKVASTVKKDITMATKFETPKMLTDMNDRAKAAFDKSGKLASEMGDFSKGNVEALVESTRIAAKGMELIGQDTADYTRKSFEGMTATLKSLATVKSPTEFFKLQGDYMRTAFDAAVQQSSKSTEMFIKLAGDAAKPISNRFALAAEKVKTAA
ncbi:TIGR01841 family phasin [Sphingomonas donggukensis]|uniref:TIGR01841 family phasin n=1 Tax=Sphingomonas donggukensis TaxID=2949093 RepID=A0ABY4TU50_9SPHN|nr:TIGR01841 family phasin [Sphingomonas donggukensis]URW75929.1 TIGR01841 family phasin [Sphingomonas donggukensis]